MNARLYDPVLGRFAGMDPYVQMPDFTQNYNRYAYALNNPLLYTDPTGEKMKWWGWVLSAAAVAMGSIDPASVGTSVGIMLPAVKPTLSAIDGTVAVVSSAWKEPGWSGERLKNHFKIWGGGFKLDENQKPGKKLGQLLSRWTWEYPQTYVGQTYSYGRNLFGKVDRVEYFGGATFLINENASDAWGISLSNYINVNIKGELIGDITDHPMLMHEYGHTFDSRRFGPLYLPVVGLPSLVSAANDESLNDPPFHTHGDYWAEKRANRHAEKYFSKYYGVDWDAQHPDGKWKWKYDDKGKRYRYYYTIRDYYPTKK